MGAMTTPSAFARNATKALQQMVDVSSGGLDCEGAAAIVEEAISRAMRDRDVTAHRELKAAHAAADERLMQLLSASPAVIYSYKASGDFAPTFVSGNIVDVFGYSTSEYLCDPSFWSARVHEDDKDRVDRAIASFFKNGVHAVEYRFLRKDGSYCWVNDEQRLICDEEGQPAEVVGSWSDITARKAAEEAKAAAHERLTRLLASSPAVIYSYKAKGDFRPTFVSENIRQCLSYEPQEYLQEADFRRRSVHPDDARPSKPRRSSSSRTFYDKIIPIKVQASLKSPLPSVAAERESNTNTTG
jgi:PAS domain S-box-containing protein